MKITAELLIGLLVLAACLAAIVYNVRKEFGRRSSRRYRRKRGPEE